MTAQNTDVTDIWSAKSVPDLRSKIVGVAQSIGFACIAELPEPRATRESSGRPVLHVTWSNGDQVYGSRLRAYRSALAEWFCSLDPADIARRRRWEVTQRAPFLLSQQPEAFAENMTWLSLRREFGETPYQDALAVPLPNGRSQARHLYFMSCEPVSLERAGLGAALGSLYLLMAGLLDPTNGDEGNGLDAPEVPLVTLKPRELEVIRWAAAGKTLPEIATITGLAYRTVRYHLEGARKRYGYATNQQAIVRAAIDYRIDPMGTRSGV